MRMSLYRLSPPGGTYFFSQANTSRCQYALFAGFSTQWPSSGKLMNLRRHPLPLQRREQLLALADRDAEVEVVVDDEHRRLELARLAASLCGECFS